MQRTSNSIILNEYMLRYWILFSACVHIRISNEPQMVKWNKNKHVPVLSELTTILFQQSTLGSKTQNGVEKLVSKRAIYPRVDSPCEGQRMTQVIANPFLGWAHSRSSLKAITRPAQYTFSRCGTLFVIVILRVSRRQYKTNEFDDAFAKYSPYIW